MARARVFLSAAFAASIFGVSTARAANDWAVHSNVDGVQIRMDEQGHKIAAIENGRAGPSVPPPAPVPANWQALGPFGGDIDDVQASPTNPSIVLAALAPASFSGGGIYRSTNAGASWTLVSPPTNIVVHDIEFAPDGTAYAGTLDGVWKSVNGGATWTQQPLGIGLNDEVLDVHIDPTNPLRIWIGIGDALGGQPVNVMLSIDGGTSWNNMTPPLAAPTTCYTIAVDPTDANKVFVGFGGFGGGGQVWFTPDGGATWFNRSAGLPNRPVHSLVHDGARVLVGGGQLFGSQTFGLFTSNNDGVTWTPLHDGTWPSLVIQDIAIDPNNVNVIYVATAGQGLFRSTNGGTSWSFNVGGTGSLSVNSVTFSPGSSSVIFTGSSSNAVWRSVDSGATFLPSSTGIGALDVYSIDSNPLDGNELAIAFQGLNDGGVYTSTNAGATWTLAALPGTRFNAVRFSPAGVLYSISDGPTTIGQEALYRRTGITWAPIGPNQGPLFESELFGMRVSANDPNLIIAVGADFGVAGFEPTVWRTPDGGGSWFKVYEGVSANHPLQDLLIFDPAADTTWVAPFTDFTGAQNGGVLRSIDSGVTWNPSSTGLPAIVQPYSIAQSITNDLYISNNVFGSPNGVFRSLDGGQSWSATGFLGQTAEVQTDGADPNTLYIAQSGAVRVRQSIDGGVTFQAYDTGLAGSGFPRDLQRATGAGTDLLLSTSTGSYSTDQLPPTVPYCFGDGSGTPCPCGNNSAPGAQEGCLHSFGTAGKLVTSGSNSVSNDTLVLTASGVPATTTALFFQGTTQQNLGLGTAFGDGLRCAAGTVIRLATHTAVGGVVFYPQPGDLSVSVRGLVPGTGGVRHYQAWYRNSASFCVVAATFNLTNGVTVTWVQ
jgi:hypothetical protein